MTKARGKPSNWTTRSEPVARLKRDKRETTSRAVKRFKDANGKYAQVTVLDANTATFGADLLDVFKENVAKARKENKRLFGSPDRAPKTI